MDNEREALRQMIADYMGKGYLENIIDMFRYDTTLYSMVGDLISDERVRVRLGITALIEEMKETRPGEVGLAIPSLLPLLKAESPTLRGDAANLLGIIGDKDALREIEPLMEDPDPQVSEVVRDILKPKSSDKQG